MINFRCIVNILGELLLLESLFLVICVFIALGYGESDMMGFLEAAGITALSGLIMFKCVKAKDKILAKKDGYFIVTFAWLLFSLFGSLPFVLGHSINSYVDAFFETISGFSTTGSSILSDIEALPHASLFWRSVTQWLGGLGIIVLFIAILPSLGIEGRDLYVAEVPGPTHNKMSATFTASARKMWMLYVGLTLLETILLNIFGMDFFDSICHSFTTMATGGFSTKNLSIGAWDSAPIQYIITTFMFIGGINFALLYTLFKQWDFSKLWKDSEFRVYIFIILFATILVAVELYYENWRNGDIEHIIRDSVFQVVSIITTSGFATTDYLQWLPLVWFVLFVLMFIGGCAGSTSGGLKVIRVSLLFRNAFNELRHIIHPNAIIPLKYNKKTVHPSIISNIMAFFILFIIIFAIASFVMTMCTEDIFTACSSVITCLCNVGPGFGSIGPASNFADLSDFAKIFLALLMLIGRLEVLTVMVLFTKSFWRE